MPGGSAKESVATLMKSLSGMVSVCSNLGAQQFTTYEDSTDFEDAQIALAAQAIHGEKRLVTFDKSFDTLELVDSLAPADALAWLREPSANMPISFIDLKTQQDRIRPELEKNTHTVLNHGNYILGPEVKELENQLTNYTKDKHSLTVSSGTDALLMPLMAWDIGPGDAVFTSPFTFIATAEVIQFLGATPVFVDVDPQTFNIDPQKLDLAIQAVSANDSSIYPLPKISTLNPETRLRPKAIILVDLFGLPSDYDPIMEIAAQHHLLVLADSAQGFGGEYKGRETGTRESQKYPSMLNISFAGKALRHPQMRLKGIKTSPTRKASKKSRIPAELCQGALRQLRKRGSVVIF